MRNYINKIVCCFFVCLLNLNAQDENIDALLEKVKQSNSNTEKMIHLKKLKQELFKINKKSREDASAIIEAKKKLPSKSFNPEKIKK